MSTIPLLSRDVIAELKKIMKLPEGIRNIRIDIDHNCVPVMTVESFVKVASVSDFAHALTGCEVRHMVGVTDGDATVNFDVGEDNYK